LGRSGIGVYVREIVTRLHQRFRRSGNSLVLIGTAEEIKAYNEAAPEAEVVCLSNSLRRPGLSALWHLTRLGTVAVEAGADLLLLPAANRRLVLRSPIPTVAVVHDLAHLHVEGKYDAARMFYVRHVVVRALARIDELVAVSGATSNDLRRALGQQQRPVRLVPNGVDCERFAPRSDSRPLRQRLGLSRPYLLYLARLEHPGKNHLRLLEAFADTRARQSHDLVLAGADWGAGEQIRQRARELGIAEQVKLLGYVDDGDVPKLVAAAAAVLMVGLREGFGLPALEALAAGRPVVAADAGALPEVVGDLGVMCDPHDPSSIASAIDRIVGDASWRSGGARLGPGRAAERNWDRTVDGLVAALDAARAA
jgi:glycosyltransferase involved in cell wall biosynthesis